MQVAGQNVTVSSAPEWLRGTNLANARLEGASQLRLTSDITRGLATANVAGASYVVASALTANHGSMAVFVAAIDPAGRVTIYGDCEFDTFTKPLRAFALSRHMTEGGVLDALVQHPDGNLARQFYVAADPTSNQPPSWSQTNPSQRNVDPIDTPASVLQTLASQAVVVDVPQAWMPTSWLLCTKSAEGWGDCSEISTAAAETQGQSSAASVTLHAIVYFDPGAGYDVLLRDGPGFNDVTEPLISIAPDVAAKQGIVHVEITGTINKPTVSLVNG